MNTIEEAIEDFREGKFLIVVDDEDRENEGDFIIAAEKITPEKVNFMLTNGRGVLCAPITEERCEELELNMQVIHNTSMLETPFTVTVDKLGGGCTTGVSIYDRAQTILALADPATKPSDLGRPGHINPLRARSRGVLLCKSVFSNLSYVALLIYCIPLQKGRIHFCSSTNCNWQRTGRSSSWTRYRPSVVSTSGPSRR